MTADRIKSEPIMTTVNTAVSTANGGNGGTPHQCAGCGKCIVDRYLLRALDMFWHEDCLKCGCCDCRLGEVGSTLYTKSNLLLCKRDYLRLFGNTGHCAACNKMIPAFEMVMRARANVYHLECFACQQCNHRFCVGDRFYLCENKILCEYDYEERLVFASMGNQLKRQANSMSGSATATQQQQQQHQLQQQQAHTAAVHHFNSKQTMQQQQLQQQQLVAQMAAVSSGISVGGGSPHVTMLGGMGSPKHHHDDMNNNSNVNNNTNISTNNNINNNKSGNQQQQQPNATLNGSVPSMF